MEMIMVVGFFILCASTCILAFARADHMSRLAADRNQAVSAAQSMAEIWKLENMQGLTDRLKGTALSDQECQVCWDEHWEPVGSDQQGETAFQGTILVTEDGRGLSQAEVRIIRIRDGECLTDFEVKKYRRNAGTTS